MYFEAKWAAAWRERRHQTERKVEEQLVLMVSTNSFGVPRFQTTIQWIFMQLELITSSVIYTNWYVRGCRNACSFIVLLSFGSLIGKDFDVFGKVL